MSVAMLRLGGVALIAASAGCTGIRVAEAPLPAELAWPAGGPRVRLERVFDARRGGRGLAAAIAGGGEQPLFERPHGVTWAGDDLIVADPGARRLARIAADGRVSWSAPASDADAPMGVAACGAEFFATLPESGRVDVFDARLRHVRALADGIARPTGIACAGGDVYVAETARHRVLRLGRDGTRQGWGERGTGAGLFNFPTALALAPDVLYVGDTLNFRVQRLGTPDGAARGAWGGLGDAAGDLPRLKGLAIDAAGHVWVSDAHRDRVTLFTPEGRVLLDLGGSGDEPGRFAFPAGIAAHADGRVAVVDSLNRRVQVFRLLPQAGGGRS